MNKTMEEKNNNIQLNLNLIIDELERKGLKFKDDKEQGIYFVTYKPTPVPRVIER